MTERSFKFARDNHLPFYFVSASDGTNVVRVINTRPISGDEFVNSNSVTHLCIFDKRV